MSITRYNELLNQGCGGLLLLLPPKEETQQLTPAELEKIHLLEEHLLTTEEERSLNKEMPVYYAHQTEELLELLHSLEKEGGELQKTAAQSKSH